MHRLNVDVYLLYYTLVNVVAFTQLSDLKCQNVCYRSNSGCLQLCCAIGRVLQLSMEMKAQWLDLVQEILHTLHLPTHTRDQGSSN